MLMPYKTALPRRRSVRKIFEPLHRIGLDFRNVSIELLEDGKSLEWGTNQNDGKSPSGQEIKAKRQIVGELNRISQGKVLYQGRNNEMLDVKASPTVKRNKKLAGNSTKSKVTKALLSVESTTAAAAQMLSKLEEMRVRLQKRLARDVSQNFDDSKPDTDGLFFDEYLPTLTDGQKVNPRPVQAQMQSRKSSLVGHPCISRKRKLGTTSIRQTSTSPAVLEREKEFRAIYDRLRAHYLIQEETCKHMTPRNKLEKIIRNTVHFEKELLDYLAVPNPHPQAPLVLKELRSRRADMVTKLQALSAAETQLGATDSSGGTFKALLQPQFSTEHDRVDDFTERLRNSELRKRRGRSEKSRGGLSYGKQSIPVQLRSGASKKASRKNVLKIIGSNIPDDQRKKCEKDNSSKETTKPRESIENSKTNTSRMLPQGPAVTSEYPVRNTDEGRAQDRPLGWKRSDFVRLLPHSGEVPKNVSMVVTADSPPKWKPKSREPRTYKMWLEELMADKFGQSLGSVIPGGLDEKAVKVRLALESQRRGLNDAKNLVPSRFTRKQDELPKQTTMPPRNPIRRRTQNADGRYLNPSDIADAPPEVVPLETPASVYIEHTTKPDVILSAKQDDSQPSKLSENDVTASYQKKGPLRLTKLTENFPVSLFPFVPKPTNNNEDIINTIMKPKAINQTANPSVQMVNTNDTRLTGVRTIGTRHQTLPEHRSSTTNRPTNVRFNAVTTKKVDKEYLATVLPTFMRINSDKKTLNHPKHVSSKPQQNSERIASDQHKSILKIISPLSLNFTSKKKIIGARMPAASADSAHQLPTPNFRDHFLNSSVQKEENLASAAILRQTKPLFT